MKKLKRILSVILSAAIVFTTLAFPIEISAVEYKQMSDGKSPITPQQAFSEMTWGANLSDLYGATCADYDPIDKGYIEYVPTAEFGIGMWAWDSSWQWLRTYRGNNGTFTLKSEPLSYSFNENSRYNQIIKLGFFTQSRDQVIDITLSDSKIIKSNGEVVPLTAMDKRYTFTTDDGPDDNHWYYKRLENIEGLPAPSSEYCRGVFETTVTIEKNSTTYETKSDYFFERDKWKVSLEELTNAYIGAGVNVFRLPVTWAPFINDQTFEIDREWLEAVKKAVDYILSTGAYCIINIHGDYLQKAFVGTPDPSGGWTNLHWETGWISEDYRNYVDQRFKESWRQIAEYFKDYSYKLIFETCNEPRSETSPFDATQISRVNDLNKMFYETVRKSGGNNAKRILTLAPADYMTAWQLNNLWMPENDDYVAAQIHSYILEDYSGPNANYNYEYEVDRVDGYIKGFRRKYPNAAVIIGETGASHYFDENTQIPKVKYLFEKMKADGVPICWWEDFFNDDADFHQYWLFNRYTKTWGKPNIIKTIQDIAGLGMKAATHIELEGEGYKTEYTVDEELDVSNLNVRVYVNNGTDYTVPVSPDMVKGFDSSKAADRLILDVIYKGFTARYEVSVKRNETVRRAPEGLVGVKAKTDPPSNCKIVGTTSDMEYGWDENFTYTVPCTDGETILDGPGFYYVRYKANDKEVASESVKIDIPDTAKAITINGEGYKTEYFVGDELDTWTNPDNGQTTVNNLTVWIDFLGGWAGYTYYVQKEDVSGFDSSKPTERQTLTITVDEATTTFDISISKRNDRESPSGITAEAPTTYGGSDGKLVGTTSAMEYSTDENFTQAFDCSDGETGGLSSGNYYLRYKEDDKYLTSGWIWIYVPEGEPAYIKGISINSDSFKTVYTVGEPLDVAWLTILVDMSYGDDYTVWVSEDMVQGFNSDYAVESQTLTISYEGFTTDYVIRINEPEIVVPPHEHDYKYKYDGECHWFHCNVPDCPLPDQAKSGHAFNDGVVTLAPTYETEGIKTYTCSVCGYQKTESVPKLVHSHDYKMKSDSEGHWEQCDVEGCPEPTKPKSNHTYDNGVITTEPTYDSEGVKTYTCTVCQYKKTESVPKLEKQHVHDYKMKSDSEGHWEQCDVEGCPEPTKPKSNHTYDNGVITTEPTYDSEGVKTYTCTVCRYKKTESVPKLEKQHVHDYKMKSDSEGHWEQCDVEGCPEPTKPKSNHTYDNGVITTEPTYDSEGVKTYTCTVCRYKKTESVPKLEKPVLKITASPDSLSLVEGKSGTVKLGITSSFEWDTSAYSFVCETGDSVSCDVNGAVVTVNALKEGTGKIRITLKDADGKTAKNPDGSEVAVEISVSVTAKDSFTPGDVNMDGRISSVDAVLVLRYLANFKDENANVAAMDYNGAGGVTSLDAVLILRHIAGLD